MRSSSSLSILRPWDDDVLEDKHVKTNKMHDLNNIDNSNRNIKKLRNKIEDDYKNKQNAHNIMLLHVTVAILIAVVVLSISDHIEKTKSKKNARKTDTEEIGLSSLTNLGEEQFSTAPSLEEVMTKEKAITATCTMYPRLKT